MNNYTALELALMADTNASNAARMAANNYEVAYAAAKTAKDAKDAAMDAARTAHILWMALEKAASDDRYRAALAAVADRDARANFQAELDRGPEND